MKADPNSTGKKKKKKKENHFLHCLQWELYQAQRTFTDHRILNKNHGIVNVRYMHNRIAVRNQH